MVFKPTIDLADIIRCVDMLPLDSFCTSATSFKGTIPTKPIITPVQWPLEEHEVLVLPGGLYCSIFCFCNKTHRPSWFIVDRVYLGLWFQRDMNPSRQREMTASGRNAGRKLGTHILNFKHRVKSYCKWQESLNSQRTSSDILPTTRSYLLNLSKHAINWETNVQIRESLGEIITHPTKFHYQESREQ